MLLAWGGSGATPGGQTEVEDDNGFREGLETLGFEYVVGIQVVLVLCSNRTCIDTELGLKGEQQCPPLN